MRSSLGGPASATGFPPACVCLKRWNSGHPTGPHHPDPMWRPVSWRIFLWTAFVTLISLSQIRLAAEGEDEDGSSLWTALGNEAPGLTSDLRQKWSTEHKTKMEWPHCQDGHRDKIWQWKENKAMSHYLDALDPGGSTLLMSVSNRVKNDDVLASQRLALIPLQKQAPLSLVNMSTCLDLGLYEGWQLDSCLLGGC